MRKTYYASVMNVVHEKEVTSPRMPVDVVYNGGETLEVLGKVCLGEVKEFAPVAMITFFRQPEGGSWDFRTLVEGDVLPGHVVNVSGVLK
jgi:hypothetical protein